jgi:GNAT superfamily N-acetyltransferase
MKTASAAVRRATEADMGRLVRTLGRAFFDDPVAVWACRSDPLRVEMLASMHRARLRQLLVHRQVWSTPEASSAALWAPPERWRTTFLQDVALARGLLHPRLIARLPMLALGLKDIQRRHPHARRHWYLSLLGTDPALQGRGLGSAVLAPVLETCDRTGHGAYLESSNALNLEFYTRHGFHVTDELRLPRGPRMWTMWREPHSPQSAARDPHAQ